MVGKTIWEPKKYSLLGMKVCASAKGFFYFCVFESIRDQSAPFGFFGTLRRFGKTLFLIFE